MYIYAFDISLSNTGVAIFSENESLVDLFSIPTRQKDTHGMRLKAIADILIKKREVFPPGEVAIEEGFTRFNKATQVLFRAFGLIEYLFWDVPQTHIPHTKIKQLVAGAGNATKEDVQKMMAMVLPRGFEFKNEDESDAFAVGYGYFILKGIEGMKHA